jgi:hypothetical protein
MLYRIYGVTSTGMFSSWSKEFMTLEQFEAWMKDRSIKRDRWIAWDDADKIRMWNKRDEGWQFALDAFNQGRGYPAGTDLLAQHFGGVPSIATNETPSKSIGKPRTRQPELPVEVWNVRKVDPDLAIQAVRDMCKGA